MNWNEVLHFFRLYRPGTAMRRQDWPEDTYITWEGEQDNIVKLGPPYDPFSSRVAQRFQSRVYTPTMYDMLATDWEFYIVGLNQPTPVLPEPPEQVSRAELLMGDDS